MDFHEIANIFPLMNERDFEAFKADIASNGQLEPIVVHHGVIVDGRQRYRACKELKTKPKICEWDEKGSLLNFVVSRIPPPAAPHHIVTSHASGRPQTLV